jgi:chloramphenicol 3-O-phosphotransferase
MMNIQGMYAAATQSWNPAPVQMDEGSRTSGKSSTSMAMALSGDKTMMDLQDVQRFLYMLIGSEIKVAEEPSASGSVVNMSA